MTWVKLFEDFSEIDAICKKYGIENYTINPDGTIDVDADVDLPSQQFKVLPLKFGKVTGYFDCSNNQLITLEGAPEKVDRSFYCNDNHLTTLEGSPKEVGRDFYCSSNQLTTLEGSPKEVGRDFYCSSNQLTTLEGSPKEISGGFYCEWNKLITLDGAPNEVGGGFDCNHNQLTTLEGAPKEVNGSGLYVTNFNCGDNPLPKEVLSFKDKKYILKWQDDYGIWKGGKLNQFRWQQMINDYDLG
jgi:hypothetical protein